MARLSLLQISLQNLDSLRGCPYADVPTWICSALICCAWEFLGVQQHFSVELLDCAVTLACGAFQFLAVQNSYRAMGVLDDFLFLPLASSQADAAAIGSEHQGRETLS